MWRVGLRHVRCIRIAWVCPCILVMLLLLLLLLLAVQLLLAVHLLLLRGGHVVRELYLLRLRVPNVKFARCGGPCLDATERSPAASPRAGRDPGQG